MNHVNPLDSAIDRVMEVTVGAITGLLVSFFVLPSRAHQPDPRQRGADAGIDRRGVEGIAGRPDARARQRRPAPDPGRHRHGAGRAECDRRRSRARARGAFVAGPGYRPVAADHVAAAPRSRDDRARQRGAAAGRTAGPARARRWPTSAMRSSAYLRVDAPRRCAAGPARRRSGRSTRRCSAMPRKSRRAQRGPDAWPARRRVERFFALGFALEQMRQNLNDLERCVTEWSDTVGVKLPVRGGRDGRLALAAAGQTLVLHPPDQHIDAVLSEERFILEYEGRHAPMA